MYRTFARIKPTLLGALPGRRASEKADVLKSWVRVVVVLWVLTVVPLLFLSLLMVVISAPRVVATAWDSVGLQWRDVSQSFGRGEWATAVVGLFGVAAIVLPVAGSGYAVSRFGRRASWAWTSAGNVRFGRPGLALAGTVAAAGLAFTLCTKRRVPAHPARRAGHPGRGRASGRRPRYGPSRADARTGGGAGRRAGPGVARGRNQGWRPDHPTGGHRPRRDAGYHARHDAGHDGAVRAGSDHRSCAVDQHDGRPTDDDPATQFCSAHHATAEPRRVALGPSPV